LYVTIAGDVTIAEVPGEYLPTPHRWHALLPVAFEYVPASQSVQVLSPPLEYVPAAQSMQVLFEEAPTVSEYEPGAQATQVSAV
jgi:hypothetical protein